MATAAEVERSIRSLIKSVSKAAPEPGSIPDRSLVCVVPDLNTAFWARMKGARLGGLKEVQPTEAADVRLTAKSDDLIALIEGRLNIGTAFLMGRVRVDASASDLMMLRRLF